MQSFSTGSDPNRGNNRTGANHPRIASRKSSPAGAGRRYPRPPLHQQQPRGPQEHLFGGGITSGRHHQASFGTNCEPPVAITIPTSSSSNHAPSPCSPPRTTSSSTPGDPGSSRPNRPVNSPCQSWTASSRTSLKRSETDGSGYGEDLTYDTSASDIGSCRGTPKGKHHQGQDVLNAEKASRDGYVKEQKARDFQQMVETPNDCIKTIGNSMGDGRIMVVVRQNMLVTFARDEIEESTSLVKNLAGEKKEIEYEYGTQMLHLARDRQEQEKALEQERQEQEKALEQHFRDRQQALDHFRKDSIAQIEQHQLDSVLVLEEMKVRVETYTQKVQPMVTAMMDPAADVPNQCVSKLDFEVKKLFYATRLGTSVLVQRASLDDIAHKVGLPDFDSCLKLNMMHAVAVIQALSKLGFTSNKAFIAHIAKMKHGKYNL